MNWRAPAYSWARQEYFWNVDIAELALRAVGAFYVFAGYVATRMGLTSHMIDTALAAISGKGIPRLERAQSAWLIASSTLVLAGGIILMLLIDVSLWLFLASSAGQAFYLAYLAPFYFDKDDPPDAKGRQQTWNAFVVYLFATAFVAWAALMGKLSHWSDVPVAALAGAGAVFVIHMGYVLRTLYLPSKSTDDT